METERLRMLGLRWGLVALGAFGYVVVRFLGDFLDEWANLQVRTDWRVLSARMSQLKPWFWKAQTSGPVGIALIVALAITLVVAFAFGIRDALRGVPDEEA